MRGPTTAILHLNAADGPLVAKRLEDALRAHRGVHAIRLEPRDAIVVIDYDRALTGLGDLVRSVEDAGGAVSSVAERG